MRILVVEDEAFLALMLSEMLADLGHEAIGPAADEAGARRLAAEHRLDLALVDIQLAGQGDGVALARHLRERWGLPSIFVSGQAELARSARDAAFALLRKPYSLDALAGMLLVFREHAAGAPATPLPPHAELLEGAAA